MSKNQNIKSLEDAVTSFGKAIQKISIDDHMQKEKKLKKIRDEAEKSGASDSTQMSDKYSDFVNISRKIMAGSKVISSNIGSLKMDNIMVNIESALKNVKNQSSVDNLGRDKFNEIRKNLNSVHEAVDILKSEVESFGEKLKDISG